MNEIEKVRKQSKNLTKIIIIEFAYCSILYFIFKAFVKQSNLINCIYLGMLLILPLVFNIYLYLKSKKNTSLLEKNNLIIVQILIFMFSFKFLIQ